MRVPSLLLLAFGPACLSSPTSLSDVRIAEAELRVLFIGNSLTYTNDLPGMVAMLARHDGRSFAGAAIAHPNVSLEDHAGMGVFATIRRERPDIVILQQGPSSLMESRINLIEWTRQFDAVIRESGGRSALLMVWPPTDRLAFFDAVRDSYRAAADEVNGVFIPAGESWRAVWRRDADIALHGSDGFHPSRLGSLTAALTVYAVLFGLDAATFRCPTAEQTGVEAAALAILCEAVIETVAAARQPATSRSR